MKFNNLSGSQNTEVLQHWYQTYSGKLLARIESQLLGRVLADCFGYYLVSVGVSEGGSLHRECLKSSRIPCRVLVNPIMEVRRESSVSKASLESNAVLSVQGVSEQLPVRTDYIDALILSHCLEFSDDPHLVLREADRVLIPEGRLIIFGFNPLSLWGMFRPLFKRSKKMPWSGRFLSPYRVKDWLGLLGFDVEVTQYFYYRPPFQQKKLMRRLKFLEKLGHFFNLPASGGYLIVAKKRTMTFTPVKPFKQRALFGGAIGAAIPAKRTDSH